MTAKNYFMVFSIFFTILPMSFISATITEECKCVCSGFSSKTVCEKLNDMRLEVDANTGELKKWAQFFPFVQNLRDKLRDDIVNIVKAEIKSYFKEKGTFPIAENLIKKADDEMLNDSNSISKPTEEEIYLAKNVSSLLAKVEMVENRTMEVEEELKSERRVRRHLEEEVKEAQSSLISLGDQLQNVTAPVDAIISEVQKVMFTSLDDMNRTIHEEHLQKLYYKVDGVVYRNETRKLDERLEQVETELHDDGNSSIVVKLAEELRLLEENVNILNSSIGEDLFPRLNILETETVKKDAAERLEMKMANVLNSTEIFRMEIADLWSDVHDFKSFQMKLQNYSEQLYEYLEILQQQMEELKNRTHINDVIIDEKNDIIVFNKTNDIAFNDTNVILLNETNGAVFDETNDIFLNETDDISINETIAVNYTDIEESTTEPDYDVWVGGNRIRIGKDQNDTYCERPDVEDPHLLVDLYEDSDGKLSLMFGCQPIGQYAITMTPVPVRCEKETWKGPFPACRPLLDEAAIESMAQALRQEHPCQGGSGEFPDDTDCSRFFKCSYGKVAVIRCPGGLHFNPRLKVCDYPKVAACSPSASKLTHELQDLVPSIAIEPNNLDKPSGLLGTGPAGELIVHPRSTFILHCLYPENLWGVPVWNVTYFDSDIPESLLGKEGKNKVSIKIVAAIKEDSGIYTCSTPFGKENSIRVVVKAVICPPLPTGEEFEDVYYRPTPEGEHRILGTTAEFLCEDGQRIVAVCMANGNWSRGPPTQDECSLKKRKTEDEWKCQPLDISKRPHLIVERMPTEKIVVFRCAGQLRLVGNSFTRCRDDGYWSHMSLPKCAP